mgnify:FL=1|tara:strand:- start:650 stop:1027 length:378 start_codon:yes stop_codon:yes gene_type:complete
MAKRRLTEIANDLGISFEEANDLVVNHLEEEMVTGVGKNTWINEIGQDLLDNFVPIPQIYRGKVTGRCPNKTFVYVYIKEMTKKVPVKLPFKYINKEMVGKYVYIEADNSSIETRYRYIKPPEVD